MQDKKLTKQQGEEKKNGKQVRGSIVTKIAGPKSKRTPEEGFIQGEKSKGQRPRGGAQLLLEKTRK